MPIYEEFESEFGKTPSEQPIQIFDVFGKVAPADYIVAFSGQSQSYCVGIVDMVNSTRISAYLNPEKLSRYYEIFLNSMSTIISRHGGQVIKNVGDCLVYYFPESSKKEKQFGFIACLESALAMLDAHKMICHRLQMEGLPKVNFRISLDYGSLVIMSNSGSKTLDMIGPPINMCSKINYLASPNEIVVGGDLYQITRDIPEFAFHEIHGLSIGLKCAYPVYVLKRK